MSEVEDVRDFMEKFGLPRAEAKIPLGKDDLHDRMILVAEEYHELLVAVAADDVAAIADALVDLVYVTVGTAVAMGLPWEALWADVHRANMAKVPGANQRGLRRDVTKPPGWEPPRTAAILRAHGFEVPREPNL